MVRYINLTGIQGSGKGTQAKRLIADYNLAFFETGGELRKLARQDTPLGNEIKQILEAGKLVPTHVVKDVVEAFLAEHPNQDILFDSLIRNAEQNTVILPSLPNFTILHFDLDEDISMQRLLGRKVDPVTGEVFGPEATINPKTGNTLVTRMDDTPEAIRSRIAWSINDTLPLIEVWKQEGREVITIDASRSEEEVYRDVQKAMEKLGIQKQG